MLTNLHLVSEHGHLVGTQTHRQGQRATSCQGNAPHALPPQCWAWDYSSPARHGREEGGLLRRQCPHHGS